MAYLVNSLAHVAIYTDSKKQAALRRDAAVLRFAKQIAVIAESWLAAVRLSYAPGRHFQAGDIDLLLAKLKGYRRYKAVPGVLAIFWIAEMQKRGELHFHLYIVMQNGCKLPMFDKKGLWPWGSTNVSKEKARWVFSFLCEKRRWSKRVSDRRLS